MSDDWSLDDLTPSQAEIDLETLLGDGDGRTSGLEPEGTESDLEEADRRKAARDTAAGESVALNAQIEALLNPPAAVDPEEEIDDSPLGKRLAGMVVGSPELQELIDDLSAISRDRRDAADAKAAAVIPGVAVYDPDGAMEWNPNDLTAAQFKRLVDVSTGGSREAPEGISPRDWRIYVARAMGQGPS